MSKDKPEAAQEEFLRRMKEILEAEDVTPDSCLAGWTTWDSMAVVMVLALLDELCGKELTGEAVVGCEKVSDLMALGGLL
jgi:acyl carrier protein